MRRSDMSSVSLVQHTFYVLRPELTHVLGMVTDLLWADQRLLRDWVVTKVGFGLVQTHAARHGRARWDFPLRLGEIYCGPLVYLTKIRMAMRQGL